MSTKDVKKAVEDVRKARRKVGLAAENDQVASSHVAHQFYPDHRKPNYGLWEERAHIPKSDYLT